jgi:hypothetical protein
VFPLKRSQVQIHRGVGYVYLRRLYQSNRWAEGGPLSHKQGGLIHQIWCAGLVVTLKIDYYYYYYYKVRTRVMGAMIPQYMGFNGVLKSFHVP